MWVTHLMVGLTTSFVTSLLGVYWSGYVLSELVVSFLEKRKSIIRNYFGVRTRLGKVTKKKEKHCDKEEKGRRGRSVSNSCQRSINCYML